MVVMINIYSYASKRIRYCDYIHVFYLSSHHTNKYYLSITLVFKHMSLLFKCSGPSAERMNVHQLRHLVFHVQNWGPL